MRAREIDAEFPPKRTKGAPVGRTRDEYGEETAPVRRHRQIEIEGVGAEAFSAGGDSGSIVVDPEGRATALLFAGGDQGGSNGKGLTYANPIADVLQALGLVIG